MGQEVNDIKKDELKEVVDFWNKRPCNIRHSKKEVGTKEYFDEVEQKKYFVEPHIPEFAEFLKWEGKKVLEIGTGIGTDTINFARNGASVTGLELSDKTLEVCKKRTEVFGLDDKVNLFLGNAEELSSVVPKDTYDLIYSFGVIHHTPNPSNVIEQIKGYMSEDSELRIMLYSKFSFKLIDVMHQTDSWDFSKCDDVIREFAEAQTGCPYAYTYTFDEVKELLKDFDITSIEKTHIFPYKVEPYLNGEYEVVDYLKNMSPESFRELEKALGWHTLIKAKLKR